MIFPITILAFLKIIDLCYLFQIKEYRFDRFRSSLFENGILSTLYLRLPRFPARSLRNALLICISIALLVVGLWLYLQLQPDLLTSIFVMVLTPFAALVCMSIAVIVTKPLAYALRMHTVVRARSLMKARPDIVSIGISGSYGKTSTKEFLYQMLITKFQVAKTDENKNTDVGVARSILDNVRLETKYLVAEVGAYRLGEVSKAVRVFMPKIAVITSFGNQHLDLYGSRENLIKAEGEILDLLPKDGVAYIHKSIPSFESTVKRVKGRVISYGTESGDITASKIMVDSRGNLTTTVSYGKHTINILAPILGKHNILNLLPCIAICLDVGMTESEVVQAVRNLKQIPKKLSLHKGPEGVQVLNDSGNSSVEGFLAAIETMVSLNKPNNIILSKGIIELGKEKKSSYKTIISTIQNKPIQLYTTDKLFKKYDTSKQVHVFSNEKEISHAIAQQLNSTTLILIEGKFTPSLVNDLILI